MVSTTVTTELQELEFPLLSVALRTILADGILAQVSKVLLMVIVAMPQASVVPLFTWKALRVAFPALFRITVIFRQVVTGRTVSLTVTIAEQVAVNPKISLAMSVAVLVPTFTQVKLFGFTEVKAIPQLSDVVGLSVFPLMKRFPVKLRYTVVF